MTYVELGAIFHYDSDDRWDTETMEWSRQAFVHGAKGLQRKNSFEHGIRNQAQLSG